MIAFWLFAGIAAVQVTDAGIEGGSESIDGGIVASPDAGPDLASDLPCEAARTVLLRGRVLAKGTRGPVLAARVVAKSEAGDESNTETDDDGQFELTVACGPHALAVRALGFVPLTLKHDACIDPAPLLVRINPRPDLPVYETVVIAPRNEPSVDIRGHELTTTPGALGDPFRTIESLPGVASVAWPAPIYAIRGSNPGNTGYFLDDLQVPLLFHLALGPSVIHPYFFDSMAFYPGGYPIRYGRYVAGVVTAQTRAAAKDRVHAVAELRLYDASVLVSTPLPDGNGSMAAAFRYSYTGALLSLLRNDIHLAYWDYQLRADRRVGAWQLTLLVFGAADDLEYQFDKGNTDKYILRFHRASLRGSYTLGQGRITGQLALGADHSTAPIVDNYPITVDAYDVSSRWIYQRPSRWGDFEAGLDGRTQWFRPEGNHSYTGTSDLAHNRTAFLFGMYASASIHAGRLTLTPGLRLDSYTISDQTERDLGPRLSARLQLDALTWVNATAGRFSQPPSLTVQIPAAENFGLRLYGLQTSWQAALGIGTRRLRAVDVELTGYVQRYILTDLRDPTLQNPDPLASDFLIRRYARSYGLEVMIRRPASERLHGWLSYTLSQNQRALGGGVIGPSDWDQRHILNLVVGYRLGFYTLGARGHLNTGRPVLVNGGSAQSFVRLPTFYQLDLRAERRFLFDAFTLTAYLEIVNTTMTREVYGLEQKSWDAEITERNLRIFLPSLGIRGEM